jgi:hypothetical protein
MAALPQNGLERFPSALVARNAPRKAAWIFGKTALFSKNDSE